MVTGRDEIRVVLERFAALEPELEGQIESVRGAAGRARRQPLVAARPRVPDGSVKMEAERGCAAPAGR